MTRPQLAVVQPSALAPSAIPVSQMLADHQSILQGYLDTHTTRNHSDRTIEAERRFLSGWFESFVLQDEDSPERERQLFVWEAMTPVRRRNHLLSIFHYQTAEAREKRTRMAIEDALKLAKRLNSTGKSAHRK